MSTIICPYCEHRCTLSEGGYGFCGMYTAIASQAGDGLGGDQVNPSLDVVERFPNRYSSLQVAHIETVPFFHFQPGSRTLIIGSAGCTFDCHYCSAAYIARSEPEPLLTFGLTPERVVKFAQDYGCHNIAFAVNEPTVMLPSLYALAEVAHAARLPVGMLTNGYTQPETTQRMGETFDFVNVSLKGLSAGFFHEHVGLATPEGHTTPAEIVLANIERLQALTHVEVSTPVVQGVNDGDLLPIARRLSAIDRGLPWHVFRLLPEYKMADAERPSIEAVVTLLKQARPLMDYVYFGNFVGSHWVSTRCPACDNLAIERINLSGCSSKALNYDLDEQQHCAQCGADLNIDGQPVSWHSKDEVKAWISA